MKSSPTGVLLFLAFVLIPGLHADTAYYKRVLFDNSLTSGHYYYSGGRASAPSTLLLDNDKLPVESKIYLTGPNALTLQWKSMRGGGWTANIDVPRWRNREIYYSGGTLYMWCFSAQPIAAIDLPRMALRDMAGNFTTPFDIAPFAKGVTGAHWTQIKLPLSVFPAASIHSFDPHRVESILFVQGAADEVPHTMWIDEIRIDDAVIPVTPPPPIPTALRATGYERHIDLQWSSVDDPNLERYIIYRSMNGAPFRAIASQERGTTRYTDYLGAPGQKAAYKVAAGDRNYRESALSEEAGAETSPMTDDQLLTMVQKACFRYYWEGAHPVSGLTRENLPGDDRIVATGASGFGVMTLVAGAERGFISRSQGVERLLRITSFLDKADRFHGAWPHFMDGETGRRLPVFGIFENGGDLVETAFLLQGLLAARQYFDADVDSEHDLRARITKLWESVEWDYYRKTADSDALYWHWSPEYSWYINHRLTGWNEVMITYLLAIASPTHGVPPSLYYTGWAGQSDAAVTYRRSAGKAAPGDHYSNGATYYGTRLDVGTGVGGPLFFTHYSYMGFDARGIRDKFTDYFKNNHAIALINRAYCIDNPGHHKGYGKQNWGITASDDPWGYTPHEPKLTEDNGTMTPTGALSSFPYTPQESMEVLKYLYRERGDRLWGIYGFRDAFNDDVDWVSPIYMGLNQAPIFVMIENYRTGLIWRMFMKNTEIPAMLDKVGFKSDVIGPKKR